MAKRLSRPQTAWNGFFNYYLNETEKTGIRTLVDDKKRPSLDSILHEMLSHDYKVTVSRNDSSDAFVCSITGKPGCVNQGYTYSLNHVDLVTSVYAVWFICSEVFDWLEWPVDENQVPNW